MKRASKMGRRLYQVEILEIYLLLYVFVKLQVFPPTSSQPSFTNFLPSSPPPHPPLHLFLSLSLKASGPLHLRFVMLVSSSYLYMEIFDAYLDRLQISHVAEHLLNLLTLRASHRKVEEDFTARALGQLKRGS